MALPTSTDVSVQLKGELPAGADAVAVFVHKQTKRGSEALEALPKAVRSEVEALLDAGVVTGKSNELTTQLLDAGGNGKARRLLVIGLGARDKFSSHCLLEAGGTLAKAARKQKLKNIAAVLPAAPDTLPGMPGKAPLGSGAAAAVEAVATGFMLGSFDFEEYKGTAHRKKDDGKDKKGSVQLTLVTDVNAEAREALDRARAVSDGQNFARTIASRPGNEINPPSLAKVAQELAREVGLQVRILDEKQMQRLGMGGILAVGAGSSHTPPRMIVLEHQVSGKKNTAPVMVVGKAITFDTGGISIKP